MGVIKTFLLLLFLGAVIAVTGEFIYYSYFQKTTSQQTVKPATSTTPSATLNGADQNQAVRDAILLRIREARKGVLTSGATTLEFAGTITSIEKDSGVTTNRAGVKISYKKKLTIRGQNKGSMTFYFISTDNLVVNKLENNKYQSISFDNLNVNDQIKYQDRLDLVKTATDPGFEQQIITKLN